MNSSKIIIFSVFFLTFFLLAESVSVFAQTDNVATGVALPVLINEKSVKDGDIITVTSDGYKLSSYAYDPSIYGVVTTNPAISLREKNSKASSVISLGNALVRVSAVNGPIRKNKSSYGRSVFISSHNTQIYSCRNRYNNIFCYRIHILWKDSQNRS